MSESMVTDETSNVGKSPQTKDLVDEFEEAFQKCLTVLENPETVERMTSEEMRSAVDNNIMRFIDLGHNLESYFLRKRFTISQVQPEQLIREDTIELKAEIVRKDLMLQRYGEKLLSWQNIINLPNPLRNPGVSPGTSLGPQSVPHGVMSAAGTPPAQMRMVSPGAPRMPGGAPMMQPPMPAGHLASLERSASNAGLP